MNLVDEITELLNEDGPNPWWVDGYEGIKSLEDKEIETRRWHSIRRAIFQRGDEYVSVTYDYPATEMQDVEPDAFKVAPVEPYEATITLYKPI